MNKFKFFQRFALLLSLFVILTASVQSTLAFIVTKTASITNTFTPDPGETPPPGVIDDITLPITVYKTVTNTGNASIGPEGFEFILTNTHSGENTILTTDKDGVAIHTLTFTDSDIDQTFHYTLAEVNTGKQNVTYDSTVYEIEISITLSEDDKLLATVICNNSVVDSGIVEATFHNTYHSSTPPAPTGDNSALPFYLFIALISGAMSITLLLAGKRKKSIARY